MVLYQIVIYEFLALHKGRARDQKEVNEHEQI